MSYVTDIILVTMIDDGAELEDTQPNADQLSRYLSVNHGGACLNKMDAYAGGNKAMQCDVFMGAVRSMDAAIFIEAFKAIEWEFPECAQLFIKEENDDCFTVHTSCTDNGSV